MFPGMKNADSKLACDQGACVARQERRLLPWSDFEEAELRPDVSYALLYFLSAQASFEVHRQCFGR
jgi:hypothetical protein